MERNLAKAVDDCKASSAVEATTAAAGADTTTQAASTAVQASNTTTPNAKCNKKILEFSIKRPCLKHYDNIIFSVNPLTLQCIFDVLVEQAQKELSELNNKKLAKQEELVGKVLKNILILIFYLKY